MNTFIRVFVCLVIFGVTTYTSSAQNVTLTIKITGIEKLAGKVRVGIYNNAANFPVEGKELKHVIIDVTAKTLTCTFTVPAGYYAIAMYQDENMDGEINKNFLGIPKEKFGFSNNIKPKLSAPSFDETKINLTKNMTIEIKLIDY